MDKREDFARRFAVLVDAQVTQYEATKKKTPSDWLRKKYRAAALEKLEAKFPNEVAEVRKFSNWLSQQAVSGRKSIGANNYPSWERTPVEFRSGAELLNLYRGALSARTRYRNGGVEAFRGEKNKTVVSREVTVKESRVDVREAMTYENRPVGMVASRLEEYKREYMRILSAIQPETLSEWQAEHQRNHRLGKLIATLSPEELQALTELLELK